MKKTPALLCFILILSFATQKATAQYYFYDDNYYDNDVLFEIGGSLNAMNCFSDLGGKKGVGGKFLKDFNASNTQISGGVFFSALYKNAIGIRLEGTYGKLKGGDDILKNVKNDIAVERYNRNLNFRTTIAEVSLMAEIHPIYLFINWANRDDAPPRYSPYLVGGIGYFSYNPQGQVPNSNRWVDLQPLSTEGQGFPQHPDRPVYKLKQSNIPLGLGIKYDLSRVFNLRLEGLYRILSTDYLDDVSTRYIDPAEFSANFTPAKAALATQLADKQIVKKTNPLGGGVRGGPGSNDAYFSFNFKIGLILGRQRIR